MNENEKAIAPVVARVLLRYLSAILVTLGILTPELGATLLGDPDVEALLLMLIGSLIALITEAAYVRARRNGGPT